MKSNFDFDFFINPSVCFYNYFNTRFPEKNTLPNKYVLYLNRKIAHPEFYMTIQEQINSYISSQPEPKRSDMLELHNKILDIMPASKLWFLDGKNEENKTVSNPNIGYGNQNLIYADGKTRAFYQIGISANTTGISVYIMGIDDKTYLPKTYGENIGKATVTGYCIKFKKLKDINIEILDTAIRDGLEKQHN